MRGRTIATGVVALTIGLGACAPAPAGMEPPATVTLPTPTGTVQRVSEQGDAAPTPQLDAIAGERREVVFPSGDVDLAGELDLPLGTGPWPLVVIIHHSGPASRDAYGYMAELLLPRGFAVFRFDKRGTGRSTGTYGCCEADDALAAYRAAVGQRGVDIERVFIVAQSIGTRHLAERFSEFQAIRTPRAVALLSNLLGPDEINKVAVPALIVVAASEPDLQTIGPSAAEAHADGFPGSTDLYIAEGAEHSLFDVRNGPIDWSDPAWARRYHRGAMGSLLRWLTDRMQPTRQVGGEL